MYIREFDIEKTPYRLLGAYRLFLAILVLTSHASGWLPGWVASLSLGNVGVFSFFVLSGFVIAEASDIFYPGRPGHFLLNRLIKIYPTYWASCLFAIIIYTWFQLPELNLSLYTIFANFSILFAERLPSNEFRLISMVWAVGIELRFYLLAALFTYAEWRLSALNKPLSTKFMYLVAAIFLNLYLYSFCNDFNVIRTIKFAPFFLLGFIYYMYLKYKDLLSAIILILTLFASLHSYIYYNSAGVTTNVQLTTFLFFISILLFSLFAKFSCDSRHLIKYDKKFGDMTYSIYLVHGPVIYAVSKSNFDHAEAFFATFMFALFMAILIHLIVEKQLLRQRDKIRMRAIQ